MGFFRFLGGVVVGALTGAAIGIFLAPQSGDELQGSLRGRYDEVMEEGRRAAMERRAELEAQFAAAKSQARITMSD